MSKSHKPNISTTLNNIDILDILDTSMLLDYLYKLGNTNMCITVICDKNNTLKHVINIKSAMPRDTKSSIFYVTETVSKYILNGNPDGTKQMLSLECLLEKLKKMLFEEHARSIMRISIT